MQEREKQIEEMAEHCHFYKEGKCLLLEEDTEECDMNCDMCKFAKTLYNAGFRKQSVGEWIWTENGTEDYEQYWLCSCCNNKSYWKSKFCEECGAKMKGGE